MADQLDRYRRKRSAARTPEPIPAPGAGPPGAAVPTFVIQEHHARRLHWDFRLERDGVLVSWAVPKGLPTDVRRNHLAVQTEDHPLEYASFEGEIPKGEYGGGTVIIWDRGTYECEKWTDDEVKVVLHGERANGRYVLVRTGGTNWLMHRMRDVGSGAREAGSTAQEAGSGAREAGATARGVASGEGAAAGSTAWEPMPDLLRPMLATLGQLPAPEHDAEYGYETKWDGVRVIAYLDGARVRLLSRNDLDVSHAYPELRAMGEALAVPAIVDGEVVAYDTAGRVSFEALQPRMHLQDAGQVRRLAERVPVTYCVFDLLYLDGHSTMTLPYQQRRDLLLALDVEGPRWTTPPYVRGGGAEALATARRLGIEGVMAKRLDSPYEPGRRSRAWIKVKNTLTQEVVLGGWRPGRGTRGGMIGSLLLGIPSPDGLRYAGQVGTGFTRAALADLQGLLAPLARSTSPFAQRVPSADARDAHWVAPELVGEVEFTEWTRDGRLRHPSWRGLRPDKSPDEVVLEVPP